MKFGLTILYTICFAFISSAQEKIQQELFQQLEHQAIVSTIISMSTQLDLYGKTSGLTKKQKGEFVFNKLKTVADETQFDIIKYLKTEGIPYESYFIFNGLRAELNFNQIIEISNRDDVSRLCYDQAIKMSSFSKSFSNSRVDAEWGIQKINADSVWNLGIEGKGAVIGGQDTGYDFENPIILDKYRGYQTDTVMHDYNWHDAIFEINPLHGDSTLDESLNDCGFLSPFPCDDHRHGTHTMGTMVGRDSTNFIGVAPSAKWIGCRNMERGYGKPSTYADCFQWFLAPTDLNGENPDPALAPHVINNSWECPELEGCNPESWQILETAVNNLTAAGVVVVVAAGNDGGQGCNSITKPATFFEQAFTVGASNQVDTIAGFSSYGPVSVDSSYRIKPDVVAPGVGVRSITLTGFGSWNGTSVAAPHVAGTVALMIDANPALAGKVDLIKEILKGTAVPLYGEIECDSLSSDVTPNFVYGYGRIDALAAVNRALALTDVEDTEKETGQIIAYPNPTSGEIVFESIKGGIILHVNIYDLQGRRIRSQSVANKKVHLDMSSEQNGPYIYSILLESHQSSGIFQKH